MTAPAVVANSTLAEAADVAAAADHPRQLIAWALKHFERDRRVVVTGLQAEGVAVADLAIAIDPRVRVLTIDTGRLPAQTHEYLDLLRAHWSRDIEVIRPDQGDLDRFSREEGADPFYRSPQLRLRCCHIRKVAPLELALRDVDCWLTGLRRGQSLRRDGTAVVERDHRHRGILKLNPVIEWGDDAVRAYLRERGVPEHPQYSLGYLSIGCAPCTRPVRDGEHPRAGRWWWEDGVEKECGIHATPERLAVGAPR